jgi:hypothetical protein
VNSSASKERGFVDTTVLTDILLKAGEPRDRAKAALASFSETLLPVYAIKEFQVGPLADYCWIHNVLANERSFSKAIQRVHAVSRTPRRYLTSTSIEAIAGATYAALGAMDAEAARAKYGPETSVDSLAATEVRVKLRALILRAWRKRRRITTAVVDPLSCYNEIDPMQQRGLIVIKRSPCSLEPNCALAKIFRQRPGDLHALMVTVKAAQEEGREHQRRYQALRALSRTARPIDQKQCRALGDAVFAFFAPADATILTTNLKDHKPLAEALGKSAAAP